jgi:hypothetical protein
MSPNTYEEKVNKGQTKVSFWIDIQLANTLDKASKKYSLSKSALMRLVLREAFVQMGLLSREKGSPTLAKEGV